MLLIFWAMAMVLGYWLFRTLQVAERAEASCEVLKTRLEKLEEELRNGR